MNSININDYIQYHKEDFDNEFTMMSFYKKSNIENKIIVLKYILNKQNFKENKNILNPFILNKIDMIKTDYNDGKYIVKEFYKYYKKNLKIEIELRKNNKCKFSRNLIKIFLIQMIYGLGIIQKKDENHFIFLRPEFIKFNNQMTTFKIYNTNISYIKLKNLKNYLSPELMANSFKNIWKSNSFILGLIILEMTLLTDIQNLYNFELNKLDFDYLNILKKDFLENFSKGDKFLNTLIKILLEEDENKRLDFIQLSKLLNIDLDSNRYNYKYCNIEGKYISYNNSKNSVYKRYIVKVSENSEKNYVSEKTREIDHMNDIINLKQDNIINYNSVNEINKNNKIDNDYSQENNKLIIKDNNKDNNKDNAVNKPKHNNKFFKYYNNEISNNKNLEEIKYTSGKDDIKIEKKFENNANNIIMAKHQNNIDSDVTKIYKINTELNSPKIDRNITELHIIKDNYKYAPITKNIYNNNNIKENNKSKNIKDKKENFKININNDINSLNDNFNNNNNIIRNNKISFNNPIYIDSPDKINNNTVKSKINNKTQSVSKNYNLNSQPKFSIVNNNLNNFNQNKNPNNDKKIKKLASIDQQGFNYYNNKNTNDFENINYYKQSLQIQPINNINNDFYSINNFDINKTRYRLDFNIKDKYDYQMYKYKTKKGRCCNNIKCSYCPVHNRYNLT